MSRWGSGFFKTHKTPEFKWDPINVAAFHAVFKLHYERKQMTVYNDTDRLNFIENTKHYPYPSSNGWTFIAGEGKASRIYKGETIREVLNIAMTAEEKLHNDSSSSS